LAIIIPAYTGRHLSRTLESLARQTSAGFRVYVGDDASPEDLAAVVAPFRSRLDLSYHRFEQNVGGESLARHWDRAIALSREPWLWVFSDDDTVAPDCVEAFLHRLAASASAETLFRFQVTPIDDEDRVIAAPTAYPPRESWSEYTRRLLRPETWIVLQNVIFHRAVYQRHGGFYDLPIGFGSDQLSWAKFAGTGGLETLDRGMVFYRRHAQSITSDAYFVRGDKHPMLRGMRGMLLALRELCAARDAEGLVPRGQQLDYFCRQFRFLARPLRREETAAALRILRELWPGWPGVRELWFGWHCLAASLRRSGRIAHWRRNRRGD
jgi:glycosyltransferase involved in cell wall biosynthesis